MTLMRGVPMVAASPIQYAEQDSVGVGGGQHPDTAQAAASLQQQQQSVHSPPRVGSAAGTPPQADIHAYQPPWKNLIDYAAQTGPTGGQATSPHEATPLSVLPGSPAAGATAVEANQSAHIDASSPRYQQLMGQVSGGCIGAIS